MFPEDGRENKINEIAGGLLLPFSLFEVVLEGGKKRHSAPAEAIALFSAWRSPKEIMSAMEYCNRSRSAAQCALSNSIFAVRRSDANRATSACFLSASFKIFTPRCSMFAGFGTRLPEPLHLGEGRTKLSQAPAGHSLRGHARARYGYSLHC